MTASKVILLMSITFGLSTSDAVKNENHCSKACSGYHKGLKSDTGEGPQFTEHGDCCGDAFLKTLLSIDESVGSFDPLEINVYTQNLSVPDYPNNIVTTHNNSIGGCLDMNVTAVCNNTYMEINMTIPEVRLIGISDETFSWFNVTATNNTVIISFDIEQSRPVQLSNIDVDFQFGDVGITADQEHSQQAAEKLLLEPDAKTRMEKGPEDIFQDIIHKYFNEALVEDSCEPPCQRLENEKIEMNVI